MTTIGSRYESAGFFQCKEKGGYMNITKVKSIDGMVGEGVKFERIRRITGYLVGTLDRFNDGKTAEVKDRVKHRLIK